MRYLWPVLIVLFVLFSIDFATQNPEMVVVRYSLDWLNYGIRAERPLFVTLFLTLALGILFSVFYFLIYHTRLLARMRKLRGEIKQLKKQLEQEQEKNQKLEAQSTSLNAPASQTSQIGEPEQDPSNLENESQEIQSSEKE